MTRLLQTILELEQQWFVEIVVTQLKRLSYAVIAVLQDTVRNGKANNIMPQTYECSICHGVNHVSRFHCQNCGTIPAKYSWTGFPIRQESDSINPTIRVFVAWGVERQDISRTAKRILRTVPADYYAAE